MKTRFLLIAVSWITVLSGCGSQIRKSKLLDLNGQETPKPLIIGMSGFNTCAKSTEYHHGKVGPHGSSVFARVVALSKDIKSRFGMEPTVQASCFTNTRQLISSSSLEDWEVHTVKDEDYIQHLQAIMKEYTHVYIAGHSFGGWLSMKLVESFDGSPELVKTLHTIDPISKELCFFDNPIHCVSAPEDIETDSRIQIHNRTGVWVNPYQRTTFFLHSSPIDEADVNKKYNLAHWNIDDSDEVWADLTTRVSL